MAETEAPGLHGTEDGTGDQPADEGGGEPVYRAADQLGGSPPSGKPKKVGSQRAAARSEVVGRCGAVRSRTVLAAVMPIPPRAGGRHRAFGADQKQPPEGDEPQAPEHVAGEVGGVDQGQVEGGEHSGERRQTRGERDRAP